MEYYLKANNANQSSFYNKAFVKEENNIKTLYSYGTPVISIFDNQIKRLWDGYSVTTLKHINEFLTQNDLPTMNKKHWESLPMLVYTALN